MMGGILLSWHSGHFDATGLQLKEFSLSMEMKPRWTDSSFLMPTVYSPCHALKLVNLQKKLKLLFLTQELARDVAFMLPCIIFVLLNALVIESD
jgi:hypothetical protein